MRASGPWLQSCNRALAAFERTGVVLSYRATGRSWCRGSVACPGRASSLSATWTKRFSASTSSFLANGALQSLRGPGGRPISGEARSYARPGVSNAMTIQTPVGFRQRLPFRWVAVLGGNCATAAASAQATALLARRDFVLPCMFRLNLALCQSISPPWLSTPGASGPGFRADASTPVQKFPYVSGNRLLTHAAPWAATVRQRDAIMKPCMQTTLDWLAERL